MPILHYVTISTLSLFSNTSIQNKPHSSKIAVNQCLISKKVARKKLKKKFDKRILKLPQLETFSEKYLNNYK